MKGLALFLFFVTIYALSPFQAVAQNNYKILPDVPTNANILRVTKSGTVVVIGNFFGGERLVVSKTPSQSSWQKFEGLLGTNIGTKTLHNGTIVLELAEVFGETVYYSPALDFRGMGQTITAMMSQKINAGSINTVCDDLRGIMAVTNGGMINAFRGIFPGNDGKLYFSGTRTNISSGIYSYASGSGLDCKFEQIFLNDAKYELLQVGKEEAGFIAERFPKSPATLETEIVRFSPTGVVTVLYSSNTTSNPEVLTAPGCCTLVVDNDSGNSLVGYKGLDTKYHVNAIVEGVRKEIHVSKSSGPTQYGLQPISLKGSYALILGGQYAPTYDTVVKINTATLESTVVFDPKTTIPGIAQGKPIDPLLMDLDEKGTVVIGVANDSGVTKVVQFENIQTEQPPPPPIPPLVTPPTGIVTTVTDLYGSDIATTSAAPGKIMTIWGSDLCTPKLQQQSSRNADSQLPTTLSGCQVRVDTILTQLYFAETGQDGSTQINFLVPDGLTSGKHTLVVERFDGKNVIGSTKPFTFTSLGTCPMFFHPDNYPITLQNASHDSVLVSGDSPAHPGDVLVAYSTGLAKGKVSITVNGREADLQYAGSQGTFIGLDQYNFVIPKEVVPVGGLGTLVVSVDNIEQTFKFNLD